jgi:outer membrane phospholipase A
MTIEQFMELTIPAEDKVKSLRQQQDEMRREMTMKNKILEDLANTNPTLYAQLTKGAKGK